jgi:hypothetical protein
MDPDTRTTRHKIALWTLFDSEGKIRALAPGERGEIPFKPLRLTIRCTFYPQNQKRKAQLPGKGKPGLRIDDDCNMPFLKRRAKQNSPSG